MKQISVILLLVLVVATHLQAQALCSSCQQGASAISGWENDIMDKEQEIECCEWYIQQKQAERAIKQVEVSLLLAEDPIDMPALSAVLAEITAIDEEIADNEHYIALCRGWIGWYRMHIRETQEAMDACTTCNP